MRAISTADIRRVWGGEYLTNKGKPIGLFPKVSYQTERREMHQDDVLVVQSDGVLEYLKALTLKEKEQRL